MRAERTINEPYRDGASAAVGPSAPDQDRLERLGDLFSPHDRSDRPGVVIGIASRGNLIYERVCGLASLEHGAALTRRTKMRIGSTGKHMAALGAQLLAAEGLLCPGAPITRFLPEVTTPEGAPTVAQLMNHTSGLRCAQELAFIAAGLTIQPAGQHLAAYRRQTSANFPPGHGQIYNNGAYHLLSLIMEQVTGQSFEDILRTRLFEPLGMHDTLVVRSDFSLVPGMATQHLIGPDGNLRRGMFVNEENLAEGSLVSTLQDMMRWTAFLQGSDPGGLRPGTPDMWRSLTAPTVLGTGLTSPYGYGLFRHTYRGVDIIHHAGAVIGSNSQMMVLPGEGLEIVILTNTSEIQSSALGYAALDILLADRLAPPPRRPERSRFGHLAGTRYVGENGLFFGFEISGDLLGTSFLGSPAAPVLQAHADGWLRLPFEDAAMGPFEINCADLDADAEGKPPKQIIIRDGGRPHTYALAGELLPPAGRLGASAAGLYTCPDLDASARIEPDGCRLRLHLRGIYGSRTYFLEPVSARHCIAAADDAGAPSRHGLYFLMEADRITGFEINTNRTRQLRFNRDHAPGENQ